MLYTLSFVILGLVSLVGALVYIGYACGRSQRQSAEYQRRWEDYVHRGIGSVEHVRNAYRDTR